MSAKKFVIVGAALSANKGAAAMAESVVEHLHEYVGPAQFTILTTYPKDDAEKTLHMRQSVVLGLEPLRLTSSNNVRCSSSLFRRVAPFATIY